MDELKIVRRAKMSVAVAIFAGMLTVSSCKDEATKPDVKPPIPPNPFVGKWYDISSDGAGAKVTFSETTFTSFYTTSIGDTVWQYYNFGYAIISENEMQIFPNDSSGYLIKSWAPEINNVDFWNGDTLTTKYAMYAKNDTLWIREFTPSAVGLLLHAYFVKKNGGK